MPGTENNTDFNLANDPWIPVRWANGKTSMVSLTQLFNEAKEIKDISVPTHEKISLLRLLVCIAQAAMGAPETANDWGDWGKNFEEETYEYLQKWEESFSLFGEELRFLQKKFKDEVNLNEEDYPIAQIIFHFATGNNSTVFDHIGEGERNLTPDFIARAILTYQNHFVGGSMAKKIKGNGPALKALHSFLIGTNIKETIILNCIDKETLAPMLLGSPCWESKTKRTDYLNRLTPSPCKLWLTNNGQRILIDEGTKYQTFEDSEVCEASCTIISRKDERVILRASIEKAIWRDIHQIAILNRQTNLGGPKTFQSHRYALETGSANFWSGELIKAKDAKILDAVESSFTVPYTLFTPSGQTKYNNGVEFAEKNSYKLYGAVTIYYKTLKNDSAPTDRSKTHYWNSLDQQSGILLDLITNMGTNLDTMGAESFGTGKDPWTLAVHAASRKAYDATCPRQTPRQLQAYAAGLKILLGIPKKDSTTPKNKKKKTTNS